MPPAPNQTRAEFNDARTLHYRDVLHTLVDLATKMAIDTAHEATAPQQPGTPKPDRTAQLERIARTIRRCILLDRKLAEPPPTPRLTANPAAPPPDRTATRKRIIREIEDAIDLTSRTHDVDVKRLEAELLDRLDRPDLEQDLATRPVELVITDLARDLGIRRSTNPNVVIGKRRTPEDIEILQARAAEPLPTEPRPPRTATRAPPPKERAPPEDPAKTAAMLQALEKLHDEDL